jgi:hypothetical protein
MLRARHLFWIFALAIAPAANATSVTVQMTGTWDSVVDNANVTSGSIAAGVGFTVTLTYDDATPDDNPADSTIGDYVLPALTSDFTLQTGGFTFSLLPAENIILSIGDGYLGKDDLNVFAQHFSTVGITTGDSNSSVTLVDSTETAHGSDTLTDLPWSISAYDSPNLGMYFLIEVLGAGPNKKIEAFGELTGLQALPEPGGLVLVAFACGLALLPRLRG